MEPGEFLARVHAEFFAQCVAGFGEGAEGCCHIAVAVEGEHEASAEPFVQRMEFDDVTQVLDDGAVAAEGGLDAHLFLHDAQVELAEVLGESAQRRALGDVLQGSPRHRASAWV